ncbi:MAG: SMP-30/gluconolactonase/LRE family protein [Parvibaculales bacterium]
MEEIAVGLKFPEGPIAMPDGSVILVEIARGTLSRVTPSGKVEVIAETGGGPNGAALGPDGAVYICNNGGFEWYESNGLLFAGDIAPDYSGGRIERVDIATGQVDVLYTQCNGAPLRGTNDIVFDKQGGFWFTDLGKGYGRQKDRGAVFYATSDGKHIEEKVFPIETANGVGLSPDEDFVYVAETQGARLWKWPLAGPGEIKGAGRTGQKNFVASPAGLSFFDSLAVEADGTVCVATIMNGGISRINPADGSIRHVPTGDPMTTNICFGGDDLQTAYITASGTGRLLKTDWDTPGTPLNFLNR